MHLTIIAFIASSLSLAPGVASSPTAAPSLQRGVLTSITPKLSSEPPGRVLVDAARAQPLKATSCAAEIGAAAAARRVAVCRNVSPATHPPCNADNSCAMIEDEIYRSCALFEGKGPRMPGCGPTPG